MDKTKFWKGKRVFLTGHTGFKGSWLALWLHSMGATVKGYSLPPESSPSMFNVIGLSSIIESQLADIRDYGMLSSSILDFQPDIVFHLAAQPLVRRSYLEPIETYSTNVMGTVHVLDVIRNVKSVRAAVIVTSDKCYENMEWEWGYRESDPMGGYDPYSSSKGCSELVVSSYRNSFFNEKKYAEHRCAIASVRAGNVIGGGDWADDRLVPDLLRTFATGTPVEIRNPKAVRPWQHVLEPLGGYLQLAERLFKDGMEFAGGWNFGPKDDDAKPVDWICNTMTAIWGEGAEWHLTNETHPHEAGYLKLDCSKAKMKLGWQPRWSLAETLASIVNWHKAWLMKQDMQEYSLNEIFNFMNTKVDE